MSSSIPEIKAILFDFGIVLSGPQNRKAWQAMLDRSGLTHEALHKHYWIYRDDYDRGTLSGREYWQKIGQDTNLSLKPYDIDALIAHDVDLWGDLNDPMIAWVTRYPARSMSRITEATSRRQLSQGHCPVALEHRRSAIR